MQEQTSKLNIITHVEQMPNQPFDGANGENGENLNAKVHSSRVFLRSQVFTRNVSVERNRIASFSITYQYPCL